MELGSGGGGSGWVGGGVSGDSYKTLQGSCDVFRELLRFFFILFSGFSVEFCFSFLFMRPRFRAINYFIYWKPMKNISCFKNS